MSQPVKLSGKLVLDARLTAKVCERSIAGQVEYWARLGRAIEPLIDGIRAMALARAGEALPISACLDSVDTPEGRGRVADYLRTRPFPHYEPAGTPGLLIRTTADGRRTVGRFVNRRFVATRPGAG